MMFCNRLNRFQNVDQNLALFGQILGILLLGIIYRVKQSTFELQKIQRVLKLSKY